MNKKDNFFNLNDDSHYLRVRKLGDSFLDRGMSEDELWSISGGAELAESLAAFLALSKIKLQSHKHKKLRIAILMNLIHEHNRLRPSSDKNPNGEHSLKNKLDQLEWIFADSKIDYQLIYVSGTCPWGSDEVLEYETQKSGTTKVNHIQMNNYETGISYIPNQKGGEMIFGIRSIIQRPAYPDLGHFDCMLFTDADMTFDLGQIGFLIDGYYSGRDVICGNRMNPRSILVKNMTRAGKGMLMYRHIQRKLAPVYFIDMNLHDTQCPWKFLSRRVISDIEADLDSMDWSIDTDILSAACKHGYPINTIPVTAIDSEFESHGRAIGHFRRNRAIIDGTLHQAEKYGLNYNKDIAAIVEKYLKTDEDYKRLLTAGLPPSLSSLSNEDWGVSGLITKSLVEDWLRGL
jgi:hypothetical protein